MAGQGPAPKPASQRRRTNNPAAGEWLDLPREGRRGPTPKWPLPKSTAAHRGLWQRVWRSPQATMWEGMGVGVDLMVARYVELTIQAGQMAELSATAMMTVLPELRQIEDRLGLNPKGMQDRRWRIARPAEPADGPAPERATVTAMDDYRKMIEGS